MRSWARSVATSSGTTPVASTGVHGSVLTHSEPQPVQEKTARSSQSWLGQVSPVADQTQMDWHGLASTSRGGDGTWGTGSDGGGVISAPFCPELLKRQRMTSGPGDQREGVGAVI
jgi:hypothetical protein